MKTISALEKACHRQVHWFPDTENGTLYCQKHSEKLVDAIIKEAKSQGLEVQKTGPIGSEDHPFYRINVSPDIRTEDIQKLGALMLECMSEARSEARRQHSHPALTFSRHAGSHPVRGTMPISQGNPTHAKAFVIKL